MKYKKLGISDLKVSTIAMGCMAIAGGITFGSQDEKQAIDAIKTAYNCGINFFDTAEAYENGYSEELVGRGLEDCRSKVIIASKVSKEHLKPKDVKKACENSLKRLRTDYIDVYYIHWPNLEIPFAETMGAMEELKQEGKIRVIACSNFGKNDFKNLLSKGRVEANQLPYNMLFRAIEFDIVDLCIKNNVSITCYSPLAQGLLTGKFKSPDDVPEGRAGTRHFSCKRPMARHSEKGAEKETFNVINEIRKISHDLNISMPQLSLAWILNQQGITSVVAGARNPEQVNMNVKAAETELTSDVLEKLNKITETLKNKLGNNPDMWQTESRIN